MPRPVLPAALAAALALAGCGPEAPPPIDTPSDTVAVVPTNTVLTAAREAGLSTFETAVVAAGLDEQLHGEGPFTVFAPSNPAFDRLPEGTFQGLLDDATRDPLRRILLYHVVPGRLESEAVEGRMTFESLQGGPLTLERTAEGVFVSDPSGTRARVVTPDLNRGNGVLHVIDAVLTPPDDSAPVDTTTTVPMQ